MSHNVTFPTISRTVLQLQCTQRLLHAAQCIAKYAGYALDNIAIMMLKNVPEKKR